MSAPSTDRNSRKQPRHTGSPICCLISDVHYSVTNLSNADKVMRLAIDAAASKIIPLVVAGDLVDGKAILRGECVNALLMTMYYAESKGVKVYIMPGNHCMLNEKSSEHSLNFLREHPSVILVDAVEWIDELGSFLIPYQSNIEELKSILEELPKEARLIMHQGVQTANMGHYVHDKTALSPNAFADFRVISGHYHCAQDIKCGRPRPGAVGTFTFLGSPYYQSFKEAMDPDKGFAVLMSDGFLQRVPTNIRKYVIIECDVEQLKTMPYDKINSNNEVWLKVSGPQSDLSKINKVMLGNNLFGHANFKLDKFPTDADRVTKTEHRSGEQLMDAIIQSQQDKQEEKDYLKKLWKELLV